MRLKSTFNDYYDGCLSLDNESEPLYVRKTEEKSAAGLDVPNVYIGWKDNPPQGFRFRFLIIGLGNVVKAGIGVWKDEQKETLCYGIDELRAFIVKHFNKKAVANFDARKPRNWYSTRLRSNYNYIDDFFTLSFTLSYKSISTATMPIWAIGADRLNGKIVLRSNIRLASYDFARIVPPYQAYQELRTYLCNQAAPREYIPPISDKDMLEAKGFNKESFKSTKPGGPARKQRKNKDK